MKFILVIIAALTAPLTSFANCPWDLNQDLRIGVEDLLVIIDHWGETSPKGSPPLPWDLDWDGRVDFGDILILVQVWGLGDDDNPWSCYPYDAPHDASPECITSVFEELPHCAWWWGDDCQELMCEQKMCYDACP